MVRNEGIDKMMKEMRLKDVTIENSQKTIAHNEKKINALKSLAPFL